MLSERKLITILKFAGVYFGMGIAAWLVYEGKDIANSIFLLVGIMIRDLYRSEKGVTDVKTSTESKA